MKTNYSYALYIVLLVAIVTVGLVSPFTNYSPQDTFPFFSWSLFDKAPPLVHDYMARVTCQSDPNIEPDFPIFVLEDNPCLKLSTRIKYRDRNRSFQNLLSRLLLPDNNRPEELKRELSSFLELRDYDKVVIYKRTYDPKEVYLKKRFRLNEKLIEFRKL